MTNENEPYFDPELPNWDVHTFLLRPETGSNWGIFEKQLEKAFTLLGKQPDGPSGISFSDYSALISLLYDRGFSLTDINADIYSATAQQEDRKGSDSYRELQLALNLFSRKARLAVDGIWGPSSGRALAAITDAYGLRQTQPSGDLARVLKQIAGRVPRIVLNGEKLRTLVPEVPYYIIDDDQAVPFGLRSERGRIVLYEPGSNRPLLSMGFPGNSKASQEFDASGILHGALLLFIKPARPRPFIFTSLEYDGKRWEKIIPATNGKNSFVLPPDFVVNILPGGQSFQLGYHSAMAEPLEFALLLAGDLTTFTVIKPGMVSTGNDGQGMLTFTLPDLSDRKRDPNSNLLQLSARGDLLKLFVVRKGFVSRANADEGLSAADNLFYRLASIDEDDFFYSATIGLLLPEPAVEMPSLFTEKWVRVAGTGLSEVSLPEQWMSQAIGRELANAGLGLICGGWTGVDELTAKAFAERLDELGIDTEMRMIQLLERDQTPRYRYGTLVNIGDDWYRGSPHPVAALVIIGGAGGAQGAFYGALANNVPVLPMSGTGGAAAEAFKELLALRNLTRAQERVLAADISDAENAANAAVAVAALLLKLVRLFPKPFNNRWVVVAGTGNPPLSQTERWMSIATGRMLAQYGFGLLSGGWPGVDEEVARAFSGYLGEHQTDYKNRLVQVLERNQEQHFDLGSVEVAASDWYDVVLSRAAAVVMIGGQGGTFTIYRRAADTKVPVLPIYATGGDAQRAYREMEQHAPGLDRPIESIKDAIFIAGAIRSQIPAKATKKVSGLLLKDFGAIVDRISSERKILDKLDLQKGRWGGKEEAGGKFLAAEVLPSGQPGFFNITLTVTSTTGAPLKGWVAFLLHDSFRAPVRIVKAKKGFAGTSVLAYEGFTAGAYTQDGTSLELDLSEDKTFFGRDVPEEFKKFVMKVYNGTQVQVTDDTQKLRWGGLPLVKGAELSAKVTKIYDHDNYNVVATVANLSGEPLSGPVAFFLDKTFPEQVRFASVADGRAQLILSAYEAFTIGAYLSDGTKLELDLQTVGDFPKGFYYKPYGLGKDGFFTARGIMKIVENRSPKSYPKTIPRKNILLFDTKTQKTWLVATDYELFILLDDENTRKENNPVMFRLDLQGILPLVFKEDKGAGTIKFANMGRAWYYTSSLFRGKKRLERQINDMVEAASTRLMNRRKKM